MSLTPQQAENLRMAYAIMSGIPAEKIDLNNVRIRDVFVGSEKPTTDKALLHTCNTSGCIVGYLSAHPYFKAQGLRYSRDGEIVLNGDYSLYEASKKLMGSTNIFNAGPHGVEGKKHALERLREALRINDEISDKRNAELFIEEQSITE